MLIVRAQPADTPALTEIAVAAKRHWGYPERWISLWSPLLTISEKFIAMNETYMAQSAERIAGFYAFVVGEEVLSLEHLWVLPAEMGKGCGRALFRHAQERARAMGFESFEIEADPHAAGFYERMGAERIRKNVTLLEGQSRELPVFRCSSEPYSR